MKSLIRRLLGMKEESIIPEVVPVCNVSPTTNYYNHLSLAYLHAQKRYFGGMVPAEEVQRLEREAEKCSGYSPRRVA